MDMTDLTLLVMAAGHGARYGSLKQIEALGPTGETLVDYSIFDASQFEFKKAVFVIRRDILGEFRTAVGKRIEERLEVHYVFQDEALSAAFPSVPKRKKPWGTAHAVLSAMEVIQEPFAVINADDYYGRDSFRLIGGHLRSANNDAALVGFRLRNTLSEFGSVKRGICTVSNDMLQNVMEVTIQADGQVVEYVDVDGVNRHLTGNELVSMNLWGFYPTIFKNLYEKWTEFAHDYGRSETAEFYISSAINDMIDEGTINCRVLHTPSDWFGVTHREDHAVATDRIQELISQGVYPQRLWRL